ncbi:MAG: lysophospholipid acyltransferase family protein [Candidatus Riflebacteria bacterium]|nr:lysophospholipid acyltransferase family protein [Candidatus Riflebacteria bacterium]
MNKITHFFRDIAQKLFVEILKVIAAFLPKTSYKKKRKAAILFIRFLKPFKFARFDYVKKEITFSLQLSEEKALQMTEKVYVQQLLNAMEMMQLATLSLDELANKIKPVNFHYLEEAYKKYGSVILVSLHYGLWEYIPPWMAYKGYTVNSFAKRIANPYINKWITELRTKHGSKIIVSKYAMKEGYRALKKGEILGLVSDQRVRGSTGVFVKFFERWCPAPLGPAAISLKSNIPIILGLTHPEHETGQHIVEFYEPILPENYTKDTIGQYAITQKYCDFFEKVIRERPENWFWFHKRWKIKPEDFPDNVWVKELGLLNVEKKDG